MKITQNRQIVKIARKVVAWPNRHASLTFFSVWLMRKLARIAMRKAHAKPASNLMELHAEWERSAPAMARYKFIRIEQETVFAEIHSECALRGSGDVMACHRMMEYDREVLREIGGELVVLESQATPGRNFCKVALRKKGSSMDDFTPAHLQNIQDKSLRNS
ncbi:MAG: hypothetical protein ACXWJK_00140 [Burkholderiaceae bacterium]